MKRYIVANWKMNLSVAEAVILAQSYVSLCESLNGFEIIVAPSLSWLVPIKETIHWMPPNFALSGQVVSERENGAYTGDVSAEQLKHLVTYCLVGHSERRRYHAENGVVIANQIKQLLNHGITPIVCFGEMSESPTETVSTQITDDLANDLADLTEEQIEHCLFAYEPLWAIGTGKVATPEYVTKVFHHISLWFEEKTGQGSHFLYGGSVTKDNAASFRDVPHLNGLLVGGASLHGKEFKQICAEFSSRV